MCIAIHHETFPNYLKKNSISQNIKFLMKYIWQNFKCFWIAAMHGEVHNVHSRQEIWREYAPIIIVQKIQKKFQRS